MAQSTSFTVLVAALLINTLSYCSAENVYCVTPTATSCSSCPHNSIHCATLSEYAQVAELYFTSNTTIVFLPGDHVLDTNITVANVTRLTMHGGSSSGNIATVVRNGSVGFSFTNMVDINIYSLAFTSYNRSWSYGSHLIASNSALFLQSTQNAKLVNCSFHDNLGTALTVHNTNITLADNSKFIHNQCACESVRCKLGCGITALNSTLAFIGNTSFHENIEYGAIWRSASSLDFTGTSNFTSNSALHGGAIHAETNSLLSFNCMSDFSHNSAEFGGAIYTDGSAVLTFTGTNNFINNSAVYYGGAINTYYDNNAGNVLTFTGINNFVGNSVEEDDGSAIYVTNNAVLTFTGINNFINNSANGLLSNGGAIHTSPSSTAVLIFNGTNNFTGNSANYRSGVISAKFNTSLTFIGTTGFSNNSANDDGGAIYAEAETLLKFIGISDFITNKAYNGGAISTDNFVVITFTGTINFISNSAMQGGAISANRNSKLTFDGSINFTNNGHDNTNADMKLAKEVQYIWLFVQHSPFYPRQLCVGRTIMHI